MEDVPIRNAATVILVRDMDEGPAVLMGQRGKAAVFMPNKFVFPGGAVDATDADVTISDTGIGTGAYVGSGDINNDGHIDLVVSSLYASTYAGAVHVEGSRVVRVTASAFQSN